MLLFAENIIQIIFLILWLSVNSWRRVRARIASFKHLTRNTACRNLWQLLSLSACYSAVVISAAFVHKEHQDCYGPPLPRRALGIVLLTSLLQPLIACTILLQYIDAIKIIIINVVIYIFILLIVISTQWLFLWVCVFVGVGVCGCVWVFDTLRMLYRLKPSFLCMLDLHCVGFINSYWTNKKMLWILVFPIHGCSFLGTKVKLRSFFFSTT